MYSTFFLFLLIKYSFEFSEVQPLNNILRQSQQIYAVKTLKKTVEKPSASTVTIPMTSLQLTNNRSSSYKRAEYPVLLDHLSNKLLKLMYQSDLKTFQEKYQNIPIRHWTIRDHPKRLSPAFFRLGDSVLGRVSKLYPTYALVDIGSTCYGILHARDISDDWVDDVRSCLKLGSDHQVIITGIEENGNSFRLSKRPSAIERIKKIIDEYKNLTINTPNGKLRYHVPPSVSPTPYPYKMYKLENRKPVQNFMIDDEVSGKVTRFTGMGCFIDIGATVDAFLHCSDFKLKIPDAKKSVHIKVGETLSKLYIKYIDSVRNRIGVTIKTKNEEYEERLLTGKDTAVEQAGNPDTVIYAEQMDSFANYVEFLKISGMFDSFLEKIGGTRDCSIEYLAFLTNVYNQNALKEEQITLHVERFTPKRVNGEPHPKLSKRKINISTKKGRNEFRNRYNALSEEISDWSSALVVPPKKSMYKAGEAGVWNNDVSIPLTEKTSPLYFKNLNKHLRHALDVVQGNFTTELKPLEDDGKILLENFKYLRKLFNTELSNSANKDDTKDRDNMSLVEDMIAMSKRFCKNKTKQIDISEYDDRELVKFYDRMGEVNPNKLLTIIEEAKSECKDDPHLSASLERLRILALEATHGNLPTAGDSKYRPEKRQEIFEKSIIHDARRLPKSQSPDVTECIPPGAEMQGCVCILRDLLRIRRFRRMLDRLGISVDLPHEELVRRISEIVPSLRMKRIDTDRELDLTFIDDPRESINEIPI